MPSNDDCANALTIGEGSTPFSNLSATTDGPDEPGLCNSAGDTQVQADVWFLYNASCNGTAIVNLCRKPSTSAGSLRAGCTAGFPMSVGQRTVEADEIVKRSGCIKVPAGFT